ncbi:MAG: hypothetical protein Q7S04_01790 [Candidatus Moranbacteria bacterium]|nr:hypothetical protein [Candidatus Moranbacteria bacterium]
MLPLYPAERSKVFRKKHLFFSIPAVIFLVSGLYFFAPFSEKKQEVSVAPQEEAVVLPLTDWVDEQPTLDEKDMSQAGEEGLPVLPAPAAPQMERMKSQGCVADGFLSGYGGDVNSSIALINRSKCYYLHRALETWLRPPDFKLAGKIQRKVTKPNTVYGMFIAEAIDTNANYYYPAEQRDFDFDAMCRSGSKNFWGEHTCKPTLEREEYRKYVQYIAEQAMNMGIQSFLFGEVFYQDASDLSQSRMPQVIQSMREYADFRGMKILVGAQTNDIVNENYLRLFDYIEGGVGLQSDGSVEDGPCFSRWYEKPGDFCWALLWHSNFLSKANNVFVHFDWSGKGGDDMSVFTRMDKDTRAATMRRLHTSFTSRNIGFLMPLLATLYKDNGGCEGPKKRFYSASNKYSCQDEDVINSILGKRR